MVIMSDFIVPDGGYGRIWEKAYQGSLVGSGPEVFCVWPYVIANMKRHREYGAVVLLNPSLLAAIFGAAVNFVEAGISKLCEPDPDTKNGKEEGGRRLIPISGFMYRVVNGAEYMNVRAKESHAEAQARYREKKKKQGKSAGQVQAEARDREKRFVAAESEEERDRIAAEGLPVDVRGTWKTPHSGPGLGAPVDPPDFSPADPRDPEGPPEEDDRPPFEQAPVE